MFTIQLVQVKPVVVLQLFQPAGPYLHYKWSSGETFFILLMTRLPELTPLP